MDPASLRHILAHSSRIYQPLCKETGVQCGLRWGTLGTGEPKFGWLMKRGYEMERLVALGSTGAAVGDSRRVGM